MFIYNTTVFFLSIKWVEIAQKQTPFGLPFLPDGAVSNSSPQCQHFYIVDVLGFFVSIYHVTADGDLTFNNNTEFNTEFNFPILKIIPNQKHMVRDPVIPIGMWSSKLHAI